MKHILPGTLAALICPAAVFAADVAVNANITANTTWSSSNTYIIDGRVFVTNGATLTIEPGTVIKSKARAAQDASALVIARGAKINAQGTVDSPIIFTAESDTLNGNLTQNDRGLWGGVVLLGKARTNTASGEGNIEGIPTLEPLGIYGGTDDTDNSGVMRYVSIRHAGSLLGPNNELNGLTMGAVGSGTTIEHIEVFANADDGFEWFGGTVNAKYLVSAFNDDDAFDWDEGYRGKLQFLFTIQDPSVGNHAFESDGGTTPEDGTPYAKPTIYNYTAIGSGAASANSNSIGPIFRDNTGGMVYNSIFHDFKGYAWRIETESARAQDSAKRLAAGDIEITHNLFGTFGAGATNDDLFKSVNATSGGAAPSSNYTAAHITVTGGNNTLNTNPLLVAIDRSKSGLLDPRLAVGSPARSGAKTAPTDGFFSAVDYKGAFKDTNWAAGWTKLARDGYFATSSNVVADPEPVTGSTTKTVNIATRGFVGSGGQVMIAGFSLSGTQRQTVLIRGIGPGMVPLNLPGITTATVVGDPEISVFTVDGTLIATNNDWTQGATTAPKAGAFGLPAASKDAVLVLTLDPGSYTVQLAGRAGTTGIGLVEVYEVD